MNTPPHETLVEEAVALAEAWQNRANELLISEEKVIHAQMKRLLANPSDKLIMAKMIDQSFRSSIPDRVADQINYLLTEYGVPDFFFSQGQNIDASFSGNREIFPPCFHSKGHPQDEG